MNYVIVFLSWLVLSMVSVRVPQGMNGDPAWGFKAMLQHISENSPSINHLVAPTNADLSKTAATWIFWWPAGSQVALYPLVRNGVPLGIALRLLTLLLILVGSLGWMRWISRFGLPRFWTLVFAFVLPWHHYAANTLLVYSAEAFVFAAAPWILLLVTDIGERWENDVKVSLTRYQVVGVLMGAIYLFKYTGIFISVGAFSYLGIELWKARERVGGRTRKIVGFCLLSSYCAAIVLLQNLVNARMVGAMNPITSTVGFQLKWTDLLFAISYPPMTMADAESLWARLLLHPPHGLSERVFGTTFSIEAGTLWTVFLGLPGGLLLLTLVARQKATHAAGRAAKACFIAGTAVIFCLFISSGANLYQARYFFSFSMAILPWAIERACVLARATRAARGMLGFAAVFYVLMPLAYGVVSTVGKTFRAPRYRYGATHVYNPLFTLTDIQQSLRDLRKGTSSEDVWYLTDPVTAQELQGHLVIRLSDFMDNDSLRETFLSSKPLTVHVVLPKNFEKKGKGEVIRRNFPQAKSWSRTDINEIVARWDAELVVSETTR